MFEKSKVILMLLVFLFFLGKGGKMLNVTSNYLRIEEKPNTGVYEYEVRFSPNVDMRNERFRLIRQIEPIIGTVRVSTKQG